MQYRLQTATCEDGVDMWRAVPAILSILPVPRSEPGIGKPVKQRADLRLAQATDADVCRSRVGLSVDETIRAMHVAALDSVIDSLSDAMRQHKATMIHRITM